MLIFWSTLFAQRCASEREKSVSINHNAHGQYLKQDRALTGGVGYYSQFLRDLSQRIRPITPLLRKGVKLELTPAMEVIVREIVAELATPPTLVFRLGRRCGWLMPLPRVLRRVNRRF